MMAEAQATSSEVTARILFEHRPDTPLRVRIENVPEFDIDLGHRVDVWHRENSASPNIEPLETQIFCRLLSDNPRVLDIGANVGWYSCVASAASRRQAKVMAFEPFPGSFLLLARNAALNFFHGIHARQIALGATNASGGLFLNEENVGDHRIASVGDRTSIDITVARLDSVLEHTHFVPDLLKIDVQGAELQVFEGGAETLRRAGKSLAICMEFFPAGLGLNAAHALADRVFAFGRPVYAMYPYEGGQLQPVDLDVLHEAIEGCLHPRFDNYMDLLVAPEDSRVDRLRPYFGRAWAQWSY
jgi:FkbM family methyltransferase